MFDIATLVQVTYDYFSTSRQDCIKRLNRTVRYTVTHRVPLEILKIDSETVRVVGLSDASLENYRNLSMQLGYIILLCDAQNKQCSARSRVIKVSSDYTISYGRRTYRLCRHE